jgi:hypothetical protein
MSYRDWRCAESCFIGYFFTMASNLTIYTLVLRARVSLGHVNLQSNRVTKAIST